MDNSDFSLEYYDVQKEVTVQRDASQDGLPRNRINAFTSIGVSIATMALTFSGSATSPGQPEVFSSLLLAASRFAYRRFVALLLENLWRPG